MSESDDTSGLVVVGAGLAGLAAALDAARAGCSVTLLERSAEPGGRAGTSLVEPGFQLNFGPHALYRAGAGMRTLAELGIEPAGRAAPAKGLALHGGMEHALPTGPGSLLATSLLGARDKWRLLKLLGALPRIDPEPLDGVSVAQWSASLGGVAGSVARAFVRLSSYSNDPERASAGAHVRQLALAPRGVLYLHGGWAALVSQLRAAAEAAGVRVVTGARVEAVAPDGSGRAVRVAGGDTHRASSVVLAVAPGAAARMLERGGTKVPERWRELEPVRLACLDVALSELPQPRRTFALGIDEPLYVSVHSETARLAPAGGAVVHAARYLPAGATASDDRARVEGALDAVQPGWRERVVHARWLPAMTVYHALAEARTGGLSGRPPGEVEPGLYVAGDWVGAEGMMADAALASGLRAGRAAARVRAELGSAA